MSNSRRPLTAGRRLGRVPQPDGQPAVVAHPLARGWRLADDQALNRHRARRQPARVYVQADPAGHVHARAVEQSPDIRHHHPGRRIRIRLQRFLIRRGPPLAQADIRPGAIPCRGFLRWSRNSLMTEEGQPGSSLPATVDAGEPERLTPENPNGRNPSPSTTIVLPGLAWPSRPGGCFSTEADLGRRPCRRS